MSDEFEFEEIAASVLNDHDQNPAFKTRFVGFCQNAMKGTAEDGDLVRLIQNVQLTEEEQTDES